MTQPTNKHRDLEEKFEEAQEVALLADERVRSICYSYIRFSSRRQRLGDSKRRQLERGEDFCLRHGWRLDPTLTFRDLGISAYKGLNAKQGALKAFLDAIDSGRIKPGQGILVESLDRISRQGIDLGYDLCKKILRRGVYILTVSPERVFDPDAIKGLAKGALELQLILERAEEESRTKSQRIAAAWRNKQIRARADKHVVTARLPAWLRMEGGRIVVDPKRAAVVRRIYHLATQGYGFRRILQILERDKVPAFGSRRWVKEDGFEGWEAQAGDTLGSGRWNICYLRKLLSDQRTMGVMQPYRGGAPYGQPLADYYPAIISADEYAAARAGCDRRNQRSGRTTKHVDVFAGLLRHGPDGDAMYTRTRVDKGQHSRVIVNLRSVEGGARCSSFPYPTFEAGILSALREVDPRDLGDGPNCLDVIEGAIAQTLAEHARQTRLWAQASAEMQVVLREDIDLLEKRKAELENELHEEQARALVPAGDALETIKSLAAGDDESRLRLRTAVARICQAIWVVFVPRGRDRLCAAQIWFAGGKQHRDYLILHRPPKGNARSRTKGGWWARSLADVQALGPLDLRKQADAQKLEALLARVDLDTLLAAMQAQPGLDATDAES
jgi:DNA invertase Pin-like site-specific DNA recombinase